MAKVGIMMDSDRPDAPLSEHFGKAGWILLSDVSGGALEFVRNQEGNGRGAAEAAIRNGCAHVVFTQIGEGALRRLNSSSVHCWVAPAGANGLEALRMFAESRLRPASSADAHAGGHSCCHGGGAHSGGCCCRE